MLPFHNAVSQTQKEKDFLVGNVTTASISLRGTGQVETSLDRKEGTSTSAVCDAHESWLQVPLFLVSVADR